MSLGGNSNCRSSNDPFLLLKSVPSLIHKDKWSGLHVHDVAAKIRNALIINHIGPGGKVATLSPLYAIEANLPIYNELSTGPFLYRVGDLLTIEQRRHFVGSSPNSIGDLFAGDPPSAIVIGNDGQLDKPLVEYARNNNYREIFVAGFRGNGKLYVRPLQ